MIGVAFALAANSSLAAPRTKAKDLADVVEQVEPSVVRIDTNEGIGSGVVVDKRGYIVTNYHVIEGASSAKVTFRSGTTAKVEGYLALEQGRDLALLKISDVDEKLTPLPILDKLPRKGEKVAAFGSPKGLSFSTSEGIVSAIRTGREMSEILGADNYRALGYDKEATWVQTTAAISGGNSGGPLVTLTGKLAGLSTFTRNDGQNLNFAIGAPDVKRLLKGASENVTALSKLPRVHRAAKVIASESFKLVFPSGRVFKFEIFRSGIEPNLGSLERTVVLKHPNGATYAIADHEGGVLNGATVAFYENREPMAFVTYVQGKRHGLLKAFDEAGEPLLMAQYLQGKKHGFCCFFDDHDLRMIVEYERDKVKSLQLMHGLTALSAYASLEEAEKDETVQELTKKLIAAENKTKVNEVNFKKQVLAQFKAYQQSKRTGRR